MQAGNPELRYGQPYGYGDIFPRNGLNLSQMDTSTRVGAMAWFHACPVRDEVVRDFGEAWTLNRYTECNWVHSKEIVDRAFALNFELYKQLVTPVTRFPGEEPSKSINRANVPPSFETEMPPMATPECYAMSRMILVAARDEDGKGNGEKVKMIRKILNEEISAAKDTIGLALRIGQRLIEMGASSEKIIYHLMSAGVLEEEGCKTRYGEILSRMKVEAPSMHEKYELMCQNKDKMRADKIIVLEQLK